jgi:hypothetical protein
MVEWRRTGLDDAGIQQFLTGGDPIIEEAIVTREGGDVAAPSRKETLHAASSWPSVQTPLNCYPTILTIHPTRHYTTITAAGLQGSLGAVACP